MNKDRRFFRTLFSIGIIVLLAVIVGGLSKVLVFMSQGGSRAELLKIPPDLPAEYTPKIVWLDDDPDIGRKMEGFNKTIIARDYVRALYQRNLSLLSANPVGIQEYFTIDARPKIMAQINAIKNSEILFEKAEMNHQLKLHFYSADGQIVSFTDNAVESHERVKDKSGEILASKIEFADYEVLMMLEDGYWRIKHLVRKSPSLVSDSLSLDKIQHKKDSLLLYVNAIKGINYYPQASPWKDFWVKYDEKIIEKDFKIIQNLGFNTLRIFVNFEQFGKGNVVPEMLNRLQHLLDDAHQNKLSVIVTLFDFNSNFQLLNYPATDRQLEKILSTFKTHPALLAWDLKNEPDIDFQYQNQEDVKQWLQFIVKKAKQYDPIHPLTIGWAYPENADFLANELDFVAFHYYKSPEKLGETIDVLKKKTKKQLLLEEFGMSSYRSKLFPINQTEAHQANYLHQVQEILKAKGNIPSIYWTLYDFKEVKGDIAGWKPWQRNNQKYFGIMNEKGELKKIGSVFANQNTKIEVSIVDKFPIYLLTYIFFGVVFATLFFYGKPYILNVLRKKWQKEN